MKEKIIAARYAEAYLAFAKSSIGLEKAIEDLKNLKTIISSNPDFEEFLYNLEITDEEKSQVINRVLPQGFSEETKQFLELLIKKMRIRFVSEICDYVRVTHSHGEAQDAVLKTSYPIDLELIQEIKTKLENKLQKKLNLYLSLDSDLLGGVKVELGNRIIDGSLRKRLVELKEKLLKAA